MSRPGVTYRAAPGADIEKPAHVDEERMRHISDSALFAALDLDLPALAGVREAVRREDYEAAARAWAAYAAERRRDLPPPIRGDHIRRALETPRPPESVLIEAARLAAEPVPWTDRSMGKTVFYGFHYLPWLGVLIDAYRLTGDEQHVTTFARLFDEWYACRDLVIGELPPLDAIWYTLGLATRNTVFTEAFEAFRSSPALAPAMQVRLLKTILGGCRWLVEEHDGFRYGNWQVAGVTCLAELGDYWREFREAEEWRTTGWARVREHLALDHDADGGHHERSASYHAWVTEQYTRLALSTREGLEGNLAGDGRLHAMFTWYLAQCSPLGCAANFNDSGLTSVGPQAVLGAVLSRDARLKWLAGQFGVPADIDAILAGLPALPDGRTAAAVYAGIAALSPEEASAILPDSKVAFLRDGYGPDDLYLAVNYGPHVEHELESHSHFDPLGFICMGLGVPLAVEGGSPDNYTDPSYYNWYQAAVSHNVVVVDGRDPAPEERDGTLLAWAATPVADLFQAEHAGYRRCGVPRHRRTISLAHGRYWLVHDELDLTGEHRCDWQLYLPYNFMVRDGRAWPASGPGLVVWPAAGGALAAGRSGPMVVPGPRAFRGTFERRTVHGVHNTVSTSSPGAHRVAFLHVLYPISSAAACELDVSPLAFDAGRGEACTVTHPGGRDTWVIAAAGSGAWSAGGWQGEAGSFFHRREGDWFASGVSYLLKRGEAEPLLAASGPLASIAAWRSTGRMMGQVTATAKTFVNLDTGRTPTALYLNGIRVPHEGGPAGLACFQLPHAGTYRFEVS